jgi:hypothetical protein
MLHLKPVVLSGLGYFSSSCCSDGVDGSKGLRVLILVCGRRSLISVIGVLEGILSQFGPEANIDRLSVGGQTVDLCRIRCRLAADAEVV